MKIMFDLLATILILFGGLAGYATIMHFTLKLEEKWETRTVQSFKSQLFLSSKTPNYGGYEAIDGWLVTLSDGIEVAVKKLLHNGGGIVQNYTPTVGESAFRLIRTEYGFKVPFAEIPKSVE